MADSSSTEAPFLSELCSDPPKLEDDDYYIPSLDSAIEVCMGGSELKWFLQALVVSFAWFFDAQQTFLAVFTDAAPKWHLRGDPMSGAAADICRLPGDAWAWDEPPEASMVSEFGLQCSGALMAGLPASSFFLGSVVGGLALATLADSSLGRKKMLFLSCLAMAISTFITAFSAADVWAYSLLRFTAGVARSTIGTCALVLGTELVGKRWRGQIGVSGFVFFTLGFLSLPAMAYANRTSSWRNLYLWTSIPTIAYSVAVYFFVGESPRWLFVQGRREEAIVALNNPDKRLSLLNVHFNEQRTTVDLYSAIKILVAKRWALRRLATVMAVSFGLGLVYYGMPLALGNLSFNLYLSVTLNALSEFPSSVITFFLVGKLDRKSSMLLFTSLSGICGVMSSLKLWQNLWKGYFQIGLETVSFLGACTACDVLLIYAVELFPTCVRNSAVSILRQALFLGAVFGPPLAEAGGAAAYAVFGAAIGFCGVFVLFLPETRGREISDTMDEEEFKLQRHVDLC